MEAKIDRTDGYAVIRRKCQKIAAILRDIALLIGEQKETWTNLETGGTIMPGLGLLNEAASLNNGIKHLQQGIFNVAVCGYYKTGKSTLLNAVLGSNLLPTSSQPTTAVITALVYGTQEEVLIYEEGRTYPVSWELFCQNFILSQTDISTLDAQGNIDSRLKRVHYAHVERQHAILASGIRLFDTPGLGVSLISPLVTPRFLKSSENVIIIVFNAVQPFPKEVLDFLSTVIGPKRRDNIFFVINRINQVSKERVDALKLSVPHALRQHFSDEGYAFDNDLYTQRVFFVNAKAALEARLSDPQDNARLVASGIPGLELALERFLTSPERFSQAIEPTLQAATAIVNRVHQRIAELKGTLQDSDNQNQRLQVVNETMRLDTLEQKLLALVEKANHIVRDDLTVTEKPKLSSLTTHPGHLYAGPSSPLENTLNIANGGNMNQPHSTSSSERRDVPTPEQVDQTAQAAAAVTQKRPESAAESPSENAHASSSSTPLTLMRIEEQLRELQRDIVDQEAEKYFPGKQQAMGEGLQEWGREIRRALTFCQLISSKQKRITPLLDYQVRQHLTEAVHQLNFRRPFQVKAIGHTGAGKSTLLSAIFGEANDVFPTSTTVVTE